MIVICLEGCHGSGKTELCKQFLRAGFNVLDENFLDMPSFPSMHPQSLVMETIWVTNWIQRLLRIQQMIMKNEHPTNNNNTNANANTTTTTTPKDHVFVVDRSPYSAVFYAQKNGNLLVPLISQHISDLTQANIHIITVYIKVDKRILWNRIQERLVREPERKKYKEDSREWMETTVKFYESFSHLWNLTVDNSATTLQDLMNSLLFLVKVNYSMPTIECAVVPQVATVASGL